MRLLGFLRDLRAMVEPLLDLDEQKSIIKLLVFQKLIMTLLSYTTITSQMFPILVTSLN